MSTGKQALLPNSFNPNENMPAKPSKLPWRVKIELCF
jgi:hypothetical protein